MTSVLVISASSAVFDRLTALSGIELKAVSVIDDTRELVTALEDDRAPDVIVFGDSLDPAYAVRLAQYLDQRLPEVGKLVVGSAAELGSQGHAVLPPDAAPSEFAEVLSRVRDGGESVIGYREQAPAHAPEDPVPGGRALVVASPKGGVGKSTIAVNLALELALLHPRRVVLVDFDSQFGDVASLLDIVPERTVVDAIRASGDSVVIKTLLAQHPKGLVVLAAPELPTDADTVSIDQAQQLIATLKSLFPIVVVDTGSGLTDHTLGALEASDEAILVTTMDVASLRGLRREIEVLDALSIAPKRHLVVNFADKSSGLSLTDIEGVLGMEPSVVLERDPGVVLANNQGTPLAMAKKKSEVAKLLAEFAAALAPASFASAHRFGRKER